MSCFNELMPLLFGTDNADTTITAMEQYDKDANDMYLFIGGSTWDTNLIEGAPQRKAAWVSSIMVQTKSATSDDTKVAWFKYFKNNEDLSDVIAIRKQGDQLYLLLKDINSNHYLSIIDREAGHTHYQFQIKTHDCTQGISTLNFEQDAFV